MKDWIWRSLAALLGLFAVLGGYVHMIGHLFSVPPRDPFYTFAFSWDVLALLGAVLAIVRPTRAVRLLLVLALIAVLWLLLWTGARADGENLSLLGGAELFGFWFALTAGPQLLAIAALQHAIRVGRKRAHPA